MYTQDELSEWEAEASQELLEGAALVIGAVRFRDGVPIVALIGGDVERLLGALARAGAVLHQMQPGDFLANARVIAELGGPVPHTDDTPPAFRQAIEVIDL